MSDTPHLHVEFYADAEKNERLSAEAGRPVFEDKEFVRIRFVGDKQNTFVAPAHAQSTVRDEASGRFLTYAEQFPRHYEAFKKDMEFRGTGAPLEQLGLSPAKIRELNAANIYTVEALASLDGTMLQKLGMGARDMKNQAEAYLAATSDNAGLSKLEAENAELRERLEKMEAMLAGKADDGATKKQEYDVSKSPFADWDAETIKLWLEEQGAPKPHHNTGLAKLIQIADEWNEKLKSDKAD